MELIRGQKVPLSSLLPDATGRVEIFAQAHPAVCFDVACFGLDADGQCSDDRYLIFYNQQSSPCQGVVEESRNDEDLHTFRLALNRLPTTIQRLIFTLSIDGAGVMQQLTEGEIRLCWDGDVVTCYPFRGADFQQEKALMVGEFYRRGGEWRFGAVGQGFNGGLSALLAYFGVEEEETENTVADTEIEDADAATAHFGYDVGTTERGDTAQRAFRGLLARCLSDGVLIPEEMASLEACCQQRNLVLRVALEQNQDLVENFLHGMLADIASRSLVPPEEEAAITSVVRFLNPSLAVKREIAHVLSRVKLIQRVKCGQINAIPHDKAELILKTDELVWFKKGRVTLVRQLKRRTDHHEGDLWVTSERLVFRSLEYPAEIPWRQVLDFEGDAAELLIIGKTKRTTCTFQLQEASRAEDSLLIHGGGELLEAYVDQALKRFHRQLNLRVTTRKSRAISQAVKQAVWQRDQGRCCQCSASDYLEFDHIIPFAKGGSNAAQNIQLLCRRCNLSKGSRL